MMNIVIKVFSDMIVDKLAKTLDRRCMYAINSELLQNLSQILGLNR